MNEFFFVSLAQFIGKGELALETKLVFAAANKHGNVIAFF